MAFWPLCSDDCCEAFFALCNTPMSANASEEAGNETADWRPKDHFFLEHSFDNGCIRFENRNGSDSAVTFDHASNAPWRKLWSGEGRVSVCLWSELGGARMGLRAGNEIGAFAAARRH